MYFWMYHTVHTPPKVDGKFRLWVQLNPSNYTSPPDPTPTVLEAVIAAAGGRKPPEAATDAENTDTAGTEAEGEENQGNTEEPTNLSTAVEGDDENLNDGEEQQPSGQEGSQPGGENSENETAPDEGAGEEGD